jgi:hypothetical protein
VTQKFSEDQKPLIEKVFSTPYENFGINQEEVKE